MSTLNPTQKRLRADLVCLRMAARGWVRINRMTRDNMKRFEVNRDLAMACGNTEVEQDARARIQEFREQLIDYRSYLVEIGRRFNWLSREVNEHLPREAWLEALSVNRSEWETDDMRQHGNSPLNVVAVLRLENSATKDEGDADQRQVGPRHS